jgi:Adenylosuccinate lyase C-terminus
MAGDLFRPIFVPERFSEAVSGRAWIGAMLVCRNALDLVLPEIDGISAASRRVLESGKPLREQLLSEPRLGEVLSERQIDAVLDPARYLGSAGEFVDRALKLYREGEIK